MKFSARRYKVGDVVMLRSCKGAAYLPDESRVLVEAGKNHKHAIPQQPGRAPLV